MNKSDYDNLGPKIKKLRVEMDFTQAQVMRTEYQNKRTSNQYQQVAEALDVTPGYISNVENNRTAMSLRILIYYAQLMGISLDSLVGRIDSDYQSTALDNEICDIIHQMSTDNKEKLLRTLKIWNKEL